MYRIVSVTGSLVFVDDWIYFEIDDDDDVFYETDGEWVVDVDLVICDASFWLEGIFEKITSFETPTSIRRS